MSPVSPPAQALAWVEERSPADGDRLEFLPLTAPSLAAVEQIRAETAGRSIAAAECGWLLVRGKLCRASKPAPRSNVAVSWWRHAKTKPEFWRGKRHRTQASYFTGVEACKPFATFSACRITRSKFWPAIFFTSASLYPRRNISASNAGYLETSSRPLIAP